MDTLDLGWILQRGYYVTLGVAATLLESAQEPNKGLESLNALQQDFKLVAQELAEKGVTTEAEARRFVDTLLASQFGKQDGQESTDGTGVTTVTTTAKPVSDKNVGLEDELKDLTKQVAALRSELESLQRK